MSGFPSHLRHWRKQRRFSQLDLSVETGVSSRHISFLETGRARPSAGMIATLARVLAVPKAAHNQMLLAAGFAPRFPNDTLDDAAMAPIKQAMEWTLDHHAPYPALVLDGVWNIVSFNTPARKIFGLLGLTQGSSMLELLTGPILPQIVENWAEVASHTCQRLRLESQTKGGCPKLDQTADYLAGISPMTPPTSPLITTHLKLGDQTISTFSTLARYSGSNSLTLDDLQLELFFPADDVTKNWLQRL